VRNPLASIIGFSDLLQRDFPEDHASSGIAKNISRGARELNRIITDILNYIRKTEPEYRNLDIIKFIRETVDFLKNEPYAEKIRIEFETEFESISYRFDPLLFRQMFVNIARNAYQAMEPEGGILNIRLEKTGDQALKIVFSDTGGGFPQEDAGKLFKPFYTTFPQGTGLGLPMVKRIVDFHNGAVSASIADSGGAAIIVELPI
jgi:two-component system sensor histidine kinase HydH